jgi:hypothetical protein
LVVDVKTPAIAGVFVWFQAKKTEFT